MNQIDRAIHEFQSVDQLAKRDQWVNRIHPLVKLLLTVLSIAFIVSVPKYELQVLMGLIIYPVLLFQLSNLSFREALYRLRIVLPLVIVIGLPNPFFDREISLRIGSLAISGGVLSMLSLMLKGILSVLSSYVLIATTPIEGICYALRCIKVPQILVTEILLIYRYIAVLMDEVRRITEAYSLRAPGQKGVAFRAWGSLAGQLLLGSMARAERLYESMCLRGFQGEFPGEKHPLVRRDFLYLGLITLLLLVLRFVPVAELVGGMFI